MEPTVLLCAVVVILVAFFVLPVRRGKACSEKPCDHEVSRTPRDHVIIIGAGMAGLFAGRVLSDYFKKVTIVDRDALSDDDTGVASTRRGTPQGFHHHMMPMKGARTLDVLFPGLIEELFADGATQLNLASDFLIVFKGVRALNSKHGPLDLTGIASSRPFLESHVRARVRRIPNVTFCQATVDELLHERQGDASVVYGAVLRSKDGKDADLHADMVVDASGRRSRLSKYLESMGLPEPPSECLDVSISYCTAVFKPTPEQLAALSWRNFAAVPPEYVQANLFVIMAIEHGCFMVGIYGYGRHLVAPTDVEKLKVLTSSMLHGEVLRTVLDTWQQVTPFKSYIDASSYVKRFEKLQPGDWPENFIALGDAVSAFNPQYGQGMTASALESVAIGDVLRKHLTEHYTRDWCGVALQCQKAIAPVVAEFWATGATEDLMRPTTTVVRGPGPSSALHFRMGMCGGNACGGW
eukprot:TRINITY_DN1249_c0_g1_i5.p1 TRINITY_DN1249_c0_g1~~TRINITY_DN1249_c0_g1_i5.p1  ORF type:complete len:467 (+),score=59.74 TRINITY_DN1249_c0_g1_i5:137-1537(+)